MNQNQNRYEDIMRALVWRYVSAQHRKCDDSAVTEDDINEVKTEISAFRYEMLEILGRNGMDVSSAAKKEKPVRGKRTKVWERRLMKDFQVAIIPVDSEKNEEIDNNNIVVEPSPATEDPKSKFKRVARQIANDTIAHKWNEVLQSVTQNSQIGRCHNRDSFRNQQNLMKAIEEAKKLVLLSPSAEPRVCSPVEFIDDAGNSLIELLNEISAEVGNNTKLNEKISTLKKRQQQQKQQQHLLDQQQSRQKEQCYQEEQQNHLQSQHYNKETEIQLSSITPPPPIKKDAISKSPLVDSHKTITPPPMFSNKHPKDIFELIDKASQNQPNSNNNPSNISEKLISKEKQKHLPEIKITATDNSNHHQQQILNPTGLITLRAPPGKIKKVAPPVPPSISQQNNGEDQAILRRRPRSPSPSPTGPIANVFRKSDSLPDSSDAPIVFVSLNDSTEKLIPRALSPTESDTSTLPPNSPRLGERFKDVEMVKRKAGWL